MNQETILDRLMAPMTDDQFVREAWQRRAVHARPASATRLELPTMTRVFELLAADAAGLALSAGYEDARAKHRQMVIEPRQARFFMDAGLTIQINGLAKRFPALEEILASLRARLRLTRPGDAAMFASTTGSGYAMHFDAMDMWIVQVHGTKRWWYSREPATPFPTKNVIWDRAGDRRGLRSPEELGLVDQVLEPGDVLYLPGGTWHTTEALSECSHLVFSFKHYDCAELLFAELLDDLCEESASWRTVPGFPEVKDERLATELLESYFEERLAELRAALGGEERTKRICSAWRRRLAENATARTQ